MGGELEPGSTPDDASGAPDVPASGSVFGDVPEIQPWRVRARSPLTVKRIVESSGGDAGTVPALQVLSMHQVMRERSILYADQQELLVSFLTHDPDTDGCIDAADVSAMKIATGLRVTLHRAECLIRDAHRAVVWMPGTFEVLAAGDLPEEYHQHLLRKVRSLTEEQARVIDEHVAGWDLPSISRHQFDSHLATLVALVTAGTLPDVPETHRDVSLEVRDASRGLASLTVTGPILEITALAHRLDTCAHAVQKAQRHALENGEEGPIPFDIDDTLAVRGKPLSLAVLRYAILTHSQLDIDPVPEPRTPYKMLVTVPAMTLLGDSQAPGMLNGITPIPAGQARALAAGQVTWQRILTDPITGAFLPVTAETYTPTAQMRLQLRLRHPFCAAPGCTRLTVLAAEDDHIQEYDHQHPERGGQTSLFNLHRLCWLHHLMKTSGLIDPERHTHNNHPENPENPGDLGRPGVEPVVTTWTIDQEIRTRTWENTDLLTPHLAKSLTRAWGIHQRAHDDALRLRATETTRPRSERVIEQRRHTWKHATRHKRRGNTPPDGPPPAPYNDPPPF